MEKNGYISADKSKHYPLKGSEPMRFDENQEKLIHRGFLLSMAETSLKNGFIDASRYNQIVRLIERKYGR